MIREGSTAPVPHDDEGAGPKLGWLKPTIHTVLLRMIHDAADTSERQRRQPPIVKETVPGLSPFPTARSMPCTLFAQSMGNVSRSCIYSQSIAFRHSATHTDLELPTSKTVHVLQARCSSQPRRTGSCGYRALTNARTIALHLQKLTDELNASAAGTGDAAVHDVAHTLPHSSSTSAATNRASVTAPSASTPSEAGTAAAFRPAVTHRPFLGPLSRQLQSPGEQAVMERSIRAVLRAEAQRQDSEEGARRMHFSEHVLSSDVIERSNMEYLLSPRAAATTEGAFLRCLRGHVVTVNEVGMDSLYTGGLRHWTDDIDAAMRELMAPGGRCSFKIFVLGLADHWMTLACVRLGESEWVLLLTDSLNMQFLGRSDAEVMQQIARNSLDREAKQQARTAFSQTDDSSYSAIPLIWRSKAQVATRLGAAYVVGLFARVLGGENPREHLAEVGAFGAFKSFPWPGLRRVETNPADSCLRLMRPVAAVPLACAKDDYLACFGESAATLEMYNAYAEVHGVDPESKSVEPESPADRGEGIALQCDAALEEAAPASASSGSSADPALGSAGAAGVFLDVDGSSEHRASDSGIEAVPEGEDVDDGIHDDCKLSRWIREMPEAPLVSFPPKLSHLSVPFPSEECTVSDLESQIVDPKAFYDALSAWYDYVPAAILSRLLSRYADREFLRLLSPGTRLMLARFVDGVRQGIGSACGHQRGPPRPASLNARALGEQMTNHTRVYIAATELQDALCDTPGLEGGAARCLAS